MTSSVAQVTKLSSMIVMPRRVSVSAARKKVRSELTFTRPSESAQYTAATRKSRIKSPRHLTMAAAMRCMISVCLSLRSFTVSHLDSC